MWTFEKPTKAGWYFVNFGDVVTDDNFDCIRLKADEIGLLRDSQEVLISEYNNDHKFMPIGVSSLNEIRNID